MGAGMSHRSNAHMYSLRRRVVGPAVHRAIPHIVISDIAVVHTYGSRSGVHTRVASEAVPAQHVANEMLLSCTFKALTDTNYDSRYLHLHLSQPGNSLLSHLQGNMAGGMRHLFQ